jgi:hypothetical protein
MPDGCDDHVSTFEPRQIATWLWNRESEPYRSKNKCPSCGGKIWWVFETSNSDDARLLIDDTELAVDIMYEDDPLAEAYDYGYEEIDLCLTCGITISVGK